MESDALSMTLLAFTALIFFVIVMLAIFLPNVPLSIDIVKFIGNMLRVWGS